MSELHFDFYTALLGEDGARDLARTFAGMGPDVLAELFPGTDPVRLTEAFKARAESPRVVPLFVPAQRESAARRTVQDDPSSQQRQTVGYRGRTSSRYGDTCLMIIDGHAFMGREMFRMARKVARALFSREAPNAGVAAEQQPKRPGSTPYIATEAGKLTPQARAAGLHGPRAD